MYTTNQTFGQQIDDLTTTFTTCSGAFALFYWGDGAKTGLRLEVGFLAKEFVDNVEWGREPEGLLFYSDPGAFSAYTGQIPYKVTRNFESPPSIRVDFYKPGTVITDSTGIDVDRFCSFITKDTNDISEDFLGTYVQSGTGQWRDQPIATSYGVLTKEFNKPKTTITVTPIGKQITWNIDESVSCNIPGTFLFYKLSDISPSLSAGADYNADRVLIHQENQFYGIFYSSARLPFGDNVTPWEGQPKVTVTNI